MTECGRLGGRLTWQLNATLDLSSKGMGERTARYALIGTCRRALTEADVPVNDLKVDYFGVCGSDAGRRADGAGGPGRAGPVEPRDGAQQALGGWKRAARVYPVDACAYFKHMYRKRSSALECLRKVASIHGVLLRRLRLGEARLELRAEALHVLQTGDPVAPVGHHGFARVQVDLAHQVAVHSQVAHEARQRGERDELAVADRGEVGQTGALLELDTEEERLV